MSSQCRDWWRRPGNLRHTLTPEFEDRQTRDRGFPPLDLEMLPKETRVLLGFLELMRGQYGRENRNIRVHLRLHQPGQHSVGDEIVTVNATIDDERPPPSAADWKLAQDLALMLGGPLNAKVLEHAPSLYGQQVGNGGCQELGRVLYGMPTEPVACRS